MIRIRILKGLPMAVCNNRAATRTLSIYCMLKALDGSSNVIAYSQRIDELAERCGVSRTTMYIRIQEIVQMGLAHIENRMLYLCKWRTVMMMFGISKKRFHVITINNYVIEHNPKYFMNELSIKEKMNKIDKEFNKKKLLCHNSFDTSMLSIPNS